MSCKAAVVWHNQMQMKVWLHTVSGRFGDDGVERLLDVLAQRRLHLDLRLIIRELLSLTTCAAILGVGSSYEAHSCSTD